MSIVRAAAVGVICAIATLSAGCSKYLSRNLTRDDAAEQLNKWQSLVIRPIRPVTFTDEVFQCGLRSGLWKTVSDPTYDLIPTEGKGYQAGFRWPVERSYSFYYTARLQAQYVNTVTGIADTDSPTKKLVEYVWKVDYKYADQALKDCFPDGSIQGEDKATFRHFDDGWRLMVAEGNYLKRGAFGQR